MKPVSWRRKIVICAFVLYVGLVIYGNYVTCHKHVAIPVGKGR